ncbi:hypothetical protein MAA_10182 [Metarhizium robertsii ARSEF 23]|uniref:Uncharacterized protein n=1 Tax=Metarhizium robertsii (strain ARSEF 23 / ATCC MYA-3075) TaxID=655844 RepID=E9FD33_METRA|nr:uncharacterized protein MAA_10182 [Metarhizium robertsii ARSEF 23]EFY94338.2 hypothetical protein MAA_10182 [Metarhizium robertsii ARSEF 23]
MPSIQIYLADLASTNQLIRQSGEYNLRLCMTLLDILRTTYIYAEEMYCLFRKAVYKPNNKLLHRPLSEPMSGLWTGSEQESITASQPGFLAGEENGETIPAQLFYLDVLGMVNV